jgi:hypothetical protein
MREDELLYRLYTGGCSGLRNLNSRRLRAAAVYQSCRSAAENACEDALVFFLQTVTDRGRALCHPPSESCRVERILGELFALWFFNQLVKIQ